MGRSDASGGVDWRHKILQELLREQTLNDEAPFRPVYLPGLRISMLHAKTGTNALEWQAALQDLADEGLVDVRNDWVELSSLAWRQLTGEVPASDKENTFLVGLLDAFENETVRKNNDFVVASDIYSQVGWQFRVGEAQAIARRLADRELVKVHPTSGDAMVRLQPRGLQEARRLKRLRANTDMHS